MNDLDLSEDLQNLADQAGPAAFDLHHIARTARRRQRRKAATAVCGGLVLAGALGAGATTLLGPPAAGPGELDVAGSGRQDMEVATPAPVLHVIERETGLPAGTASSATVLAQDSDADLRVIGVQGGGKQCVAVYESDASVGTLGVTCGPARRVTSLELNRTSGGKGGNVGIDRLSGLLPGGATDVLLTSGSLTKRVHVTNTGAAWQLGAFVTAWRPGSTPTQAVAIDSNGKELFRANL